MSPQSELPIDRTSSTVPLFSGAHYEGLFLASMAWGLVLSLFLLTTRIHIDIFEWFLVTISAGLALEFIDVALKRRRFYNPVSNQDLIALFQAITDDLGKGREIELWLRDVDRGIFLSTANPLFKAILLSESTIEDILQEREKGKALLAKEVLMIERMRPIGGAAIGLLGFVLISLFESASIGGPMESMLFSIFSMGPIVMVFIVIVLLLALILAPFLLCRSEDKIDQVVEGLYGLPPDAAKIEVLTGLKIPDEVLHEAKRDQEEGKPSDRRTALIRAAVGGAIAFLVSFIIIYFVSSNSPFFLMFSFIIPAIIGCGAFFVIFMISAVWPIIRLGGKRSTEYDIQVPFAADVQIFLNRFLDHKNVAIKAVRTPFDEDYGLVVVTLQDNLEEKVLFSIMPNVLKDIHDPELAGSLILSEVRRKEIEKRYNRRSYAFIGSAMIILFGGMLSSFVLLGFWGFFEMLIPIFLMYFLVGMAPAAYISYWKRKTEAKSDYRVARECPRLTEALQILIEKHHTLPYGITSYRTRLERIEKSSGLVHELGEFA